ncbi:hypothetical protein Mterra_00624 [Calidithermus terrae]|uniref:Uncharacterized protein n=1 Tax=Calidithermus terrae TaxID=1408545 RepID=A0A399F4Q1_9DEIN|nr:hypothetical protein [Calidithermus terrae]RIH90249.1 hypothetical protein Mterra_00624 [Calidithermus terrae]
MTISEAIEYFLSDHRRLGSRPAATQWGWDARRIAGYAGRAYRPVLRDLNRWEERGLGGSADGAAPGNPSPIGVDRRA